MNYKTTLRKEVISVLRGQAMLGLLSSSGYTYGQAGQQQQSSQMLMKDHCETLLGSGGHLNTRSNGELSPMSGVIRTHEDLFNKSKGI